MTSVTVSVLNYHEQRTCIDLFAGLGCWSLAAQSVGVRTVAMCEIDPFLRSGLERIWGCPVHPDIKTFPAERYRGVWAVFGSPPCQPASLAGKRRGSADDRWLWPPTIRVLEVAKPAWFCFENPPGIDGVGLDGIIAELEGLGYEVQAIRIPACAVDSPQDRDRFWILGHSTSARHASSQPGGASGNQGPNGRRRREPGRADKGETLANSEFSELQQTQASGTNDTRRTAAAWPTQSRSLADLPEPRREGRDAAIRQGRSISDTEPAQSSIVAYSQGQPSRRDESEWRPERRVTAGRITSEGGHWSDSWLEFDGELYRVPTGLHELADGCAAGIPKKFRSRLIGALGNAIVWKVAREIVKAMIQAEENL